jgi:molybdate transport system substrate-binding protein
MIGYCSGTEQRRKATPDLEAIAIREEYAACPEYGMAIMSFDKPAAVVLVFAILSRKADHAQALRLCAGQPAVKI